MAKRIATYCPVCDGELLVSRLQCPDCDARIETSLPFDPLMLMPDDLRQFVLLFLKCRGNIREVEKHLGVSYPTVCKRLDAVNEYLSAPHKPSEAPARRKAASHDILAQLERGEITAKQAADLLKGR